MNNRTHSNERRHSRRLSAICDAELITSLSILDAESDTTAEPLVFFGQTIDLSATGIALVLPSLMIDERYCGSDGRLKLSIYLPQGPVFMEVNPVRCLPLNAEDKGQGYLVGTRILSLIQNEEQFENYLVGLGAGGPGVQS